MRLFLSGAILMAVLHLAFTAPPDPQQLGVLSSDNTAVEGLDSVSQVNGQGVEPELVDSWNAQTPDGVSSDVIVPEPGVYQPEVTANEAVGQAYQTYNQFSNYPPASYYNNYQPYAYPMYRPSERVFYEPLTNSWYGGFAIPAKQVTGGPNAGLEPSPSPASANLDPSTYLGIFSPSVQIYVVNPSSQRTPVALPALFVQQPAVLDPRDDPNYTHGDDVPEPNRYLADNTKPTEVVEEPVAQEADFEAQTMMKRHAEARTTAPRSSLAVSVNFFNRKLYSELASTTDANSNLILAPFTVHSVLTMTSLASSGPTQDELAQLLGITNEAAMMQEYTSTLELLSTKGDYELKTSNNIFVDDGFLINPDFKLAINNVFKSTPVSVKFSRRHKAVNTINKVASDATNGKISNVYNEDSISPDTVVVLMSAMYFKGNWKYEFNEFATTYTNFYLDNGEVTRVEMMVTEAPYSTSDVPALNACAIKIPYKDQRLSMVVILPNQVNGLNLVEKYLTNFDLASINFGQEVNVQLSLPKFKLSTNLDLKENLKRLGVRRIFGNGDFSRMTTSNRDISVSSVIQKAIFEVNEKGAEAAAVAAVDFTERALFIFSPPTFIVDHPFLFYLQDDLTGLILFVGRVANPNQP